MNFFKVITNEWEISSSGALNYMKAIGDLMDLENQVVSLTMYSGHLLSTRCIYGEEKKIFRNKARCNLHHLQLEKLIAQNSWATMEEMEKVIPYHTSTYQGFLKICQEGNASPTKSQIAFATRFIVIFSLYVLNVPDQ